MSIFKKTLKGWLKAESLQMRIRAGLVAVLLSTAASLPAATLLEWNMNEGSGSTAGDSSGNGRNGSFNSDMTAHGSWVAGHTGAAGDFALRFTQPVGPVPRVDWVDAGNPLVLTDNGNFEVEMWLRADGFASEEYLFSVGQAAGTTVSIRADKTLTSNVMSISKVDMTTINTGTGNYSDATINLGSNPINAGAWQHLRLAYTETSPYVNSGSPGTSTMDFYVNGSLAGSAALGYALSDVTNEAHLGNIPGGIWYRTLRGAIDDFKISSIPAVPEASTMTLALLGAMGMFGRRRG
jgi:hypothetical protein